MAGLLAACAPVPPAPIDLPTRVQARMASPLDLGKARQIAASIAPGARPEASSLDRLTLFAILAQDPQVAQARAALASARADARTARKVGAPTFTLSSEYANDPSTTSPWLLGAGPICRWTSAGGAGRGWPGPTLAS
jgi:CRISPR system Cascade subunit CasA